MTSFGQSIEEELAALARAGLRRHAHQVSSAQGPTIVIDGREVLCLSSNNYLGLANHPSLVAAIRASLERDGVGAGASRLISGTMTAHRRAEQSLAKFVGQDRALLFGSGYAANVGALSALAGPGDILFSDALNHASIIDGARLSRAEVVIYAHGDVAALKDLLVARRSAGRRALIVTDGLFSMDGDVAPLAALRALADDHDAALVVDEAHALGVMGPQGRGASALSGVRPDLFIGTLGKACGTSGAFVAGAAACIELLENRARSYVFSTAPPPCLAAAAMRAIELVSAADDARQALAAHATHLRGGLRDLGYQVLGDAASPILPIFVGKPEATMELSAALLRRGVFAHGIRPPTVPKDQGRWRVVPRATHSEAQIDEALRAFAAAGAEAARDARPGND